MLVAVRCKVKLPSHVGHIRSRAMHVRLSYRVASLLLLADLTSEEVRSHGCFVWSFPDELVTLNTDTDGNRVISSSPAFLV